MKRPRNEELSEHLLDVDEEILGNAYSIDDAEKMKQYKKEKRARAQKPFYLKPAFIKSSAVAACIAAVVAVSLVFSLLMNGGLLPVGGQQGGSTPDESDPNGITVPEVDNIEFDSLDKVNYYAGVRAVSGDFNLASTSDVDGLVLLDDTFDLDETYDLPDESYREPEDVEWPTRPPDGHDISGELLKITTAVYFRLTVTENDEFLASKIGTGDVSAVMTDLYIGMSPYAMITFKNGDNYFSCLSEMDSFRSGENTFFSHLYIKGFEFFKDTTNGVSWFDVVFDGESEQVTSLTWTPYNRRPSEAPVYPISVVEGSTQTSYETYEFTLLELDEYYNGTSDRPEDGGSTKPTLPDEPIQTLHIVTDGDRITPMEVALWMEYYDEVEKCWIGADSTSRAYDILVAGDAEIPELTLSGEVEAEIVGEGKLYGRAEVYYKDPAGAYVLKSDFNGLMGNLDDLLSSGEWFVVLKVEWRDDYVPSEYMYERHANEYLFKRIVE